MQSWVHMLKHMPCMTYYYHLFISELRESIHNDTEYNVETDGGDNNEERYIVEKTKSCYI